MAPLPPIPIFHPPVGERAREKGRQRVVRQLWGRECWSKDLKNEEGTMGRGAE